MLPFDGIKLIESFDENTYLLYKMHPLLKEINLPATSTYFGCL